MDFAVGTKVRFIERHTPPGVEPRIGVIDFAAANVFLVKWEGRRDSDAYTREAFEKQFVSCNPKRNP